MHERFPARGLSCHLGTLMDLSVGGARIQLRDGIDVDVDTLFAVTVANQHQGVRINARVAWIKKNTRGQLCAGLQFMDVKPEVREALEHLARDGQIPVPESERPAAQKAAPAPIDATVEVEDLYALFGVPREAGETEIRSAYHKLARQLHPDVNREPNAHEQFTHISKAYSVLRHPVLRRRYDKLLEQSQSAA